MIKLNRLSKKINDQWLAREIDLEIPDGKMTVIIGRSGTGKSVLLKQMIGLIQPSSGSVIVDGIDLNQASEIQRAEILKKFGYVFQFAALLDSLTIFENVGITLLEQGWSYQQVLPIVQAKLRLVNLGNDILNKYPSELSGGMRKRVGLARTLTTDPKIILYDEPTTGLDPINSRIIHELMRNMQNQFGLTSIVISHDPEIFQYADYIALLNDGKIEFFDEAAKIWTSGNQFIHQFIYGLTQGPIKTENHHKLTDLR